MKRPLVVLLLFACFLMLFAYWANKLRNNRPQSALNPHQQFQAKRLDSMLEDQEYTLLAIKYGVPIETAKSIFTDYDLALWGVNLLEPEKEDLVFPEATNTSEVITAISNKYGIPSATVASLLIDKKFLEERDGEPEPVEPEEPHENL